MPFHRRRNTGIQLSIVYSSSPWSEAQKGRGRLRDRWSWSWLGLGTCHDRYGGVIGQVGW